MTCDEFEEQISAYLEGDLAAFQLTRFERHAAACAECREVLRGVSAVRGLVREMGTRGAPSRYQLELTGIVARRLAQRRAWRRDSSSTASILLKLMTQRR